MAANKILEKIQQDAAAEASIILEEAKKKATANADKIISAAKVKVEEIRAQAKADAEEAARRQVLIAELLSRKNSLNSQREVIEDAFRQAAAELNNLPQAKWEALITDIVLKAAENGSEELVVPEADVKKYKNGFLDKLNGALKASGKAGNLSLSKETGAFDGGLILKGKNSDYDGSFPTLLSQVRTNVEKEVAAMLFTEVK
ncbi:MAG: V-type ATP synthase subunit E family protein [Phascolarctobacterium sp.]|nr:V-type ATP synthase subunit E family protein [Phascolarctobacterium sp.]